MRDHNCVITELVDMYYGWQACPYFPEGYGLRLARLVFGEVIEWEDVKDKYLKSLERV